MGVEPGVISDESDDDWFLSDPPAMDPDWQELQALPREELGAEARRVLEYRNDLEYMARAYGQYASGSSSRSVHRLWLIGRIMGEEQREEFLAPVHAKWQEVFRQLELDIEKPRECKRCGKLAGLPSLAEDLCRSCRGERVTRRGYAPL